MTRLCDAAAFWGDLFTETRNLTQPHLVPDAARWFHVDTGVAAEVIGRIAASGLHPEAGAVRVYRNGRQEPSLVARILSSPPEGEDALRHWCEATEGEASLVLNGMECWHEGLCRDMASFVAPALSVWPALPLEFDMACFVGTSRYTPFGIHIDDISCALHLNLGPSPRTFLLWEPEQYARLVRERGYPRDADVLSDHAEAHVVPAGSFFLLPARYFYHVVRNETYNTSLVFAIFKLEEHELARRLFGPDVDVAAGAFDLCRPRAVEATGTVFRRPPALETPAIPREQADQIVHHALALRSNLGLRGSPVRLPGAAGSSNAPVPDAVRRAGPFRAVLLDDGADTIELYARGHQFSLGSHPAVVDLVGRLNSAAPQQVGRLVDEFGEAFSTDELLQLLRLLIEHRQLDAC